MKRKVFALAAVAGAVVAIVPPATAGASTSNQIPAVCFKQPLPLWPGAQLQVGYCPNG